MKSDGFTAPAATQANLSLFLSLLEEKGIGVKMIHLG